MSYLINTNVISEIVKSKPNKKVIAWMETISDEDLYLSVLTLGEIRKGIEKITDNTRRKEKLKIWLEQELITWFNNRILVIDKDVVDCWGKLQAEAKRPVSAIDSLIAATALRHDLTLATRNVSDFKYPLLEIINPWD